MTADELYERARDTPSDMQGHVPTLRRLAEQCGHVTELGTRWGTSAAAFLAARPKTLVCYDLNRDAAVGRLEEAARGAGVEFRFVQADVLAVDIEPTDLLLIDTFHVYNQLKAELERHAPKARKYILLHDTVTFGSVGEDGGPGIVRAADEYLPANGWELREEHFNDNGLRVYVRCAHERLNEEGYCRLCGADRRGI